MASTISSANLSPPEEPFSPSDHLVAANSLLYCFAVSIVAWLIIGALGFGRWSTPDDGIPLDMLMGAVLAAAYVMSLIGAIDPAGILRPRSFGAYATAAVLGLGVTTACTFLLSIFSRHAYLGIFWSLAGVYPGIAVKAFTGVVRKGRALLAGTAEARPIQ